MSMLADHQHQYDPEMGQKDSDVDSIPLSRSINSQKYSTAEEAQEAVLKGEIPSVLTWKDLSVYKLNAKGERKNILNPMTGQVAGGFTAIMGPSGSGKSTLLNALACRTDKNISIEGELTLNGRPYTLGDLKRMASYVMQDDLLNGNLTVEETLIYAAQLRLEPRPAEEVDALVKSVTKKMGLENSLDTIIGTPLKKGISGGERKRVSVAIELLTEPSLLFLDEPTTGLDSVTSLALCSLLKGLSDSGACTILCTIHQPQSRIFFLFDNLFLLKSGHVIYQGPARESLEVYKEAGFPLPEQTNPADHLMDIITPSLEGGDNTTENSKKLLSFRKDTEIDPTHGNDVDTPKLKPPPWIVQFKVLLRRCLKENFRNTSQLIVIILQTIIMAALIGAVYFEIGNDQASIRPRRSVLFFCCVNQGLLGALTVINSFPAERVLSLRERKAGTYGASSYFLAKNVADSTLHIFTPMVFSIVAYWMIELHHSVEKFFIFTLFMILCSVSATSLSLCVSALCRTTSASVVILPITLEIARLFGGFFLPPSQLPNYFSWLDATSYVKYSYVGVSLNEWSGLTLTCTEEELAKAGGVCPVTSGDQVIEFEGFDYITIGGCVGVLISYIIFLRFVAYLGIRYLKW